MQQKHTMRLDSEKHCQGVNVCVLDSVTKKNEKNGLETAGFDIGCRALAAVSCAEAGS